MPVTESPVKQIPRVGDIVLYHRFDGGRLQSLAALVAYVERPGEPKSDVFLTVFRPGRAPEPHNTAIPFAEEPTTGYWSWRNGG